jgi:hypothetical protein
MKYPVGHPIRRRMGKVHPLFASLYLSNDPDNSEDSREGLRARRSTPQKRVNRRA